MRRILGLVTWVALALLGLMTVARYADGGLRWLVLLAAFSSFAAVGFLVVLVGCLVAVPHARRRSWVVSAAVVAALGLVVQSVAVAPLFTGGAAGRPDLTVMTSNLEFGQGDPVAVVRAATAYGADVLVLEEVTPASFNGLVRAGLDELMPHHEGKPQVGADGTMVYSRYRLEDPRTFPVDNGGLDLRVEAPEPFRLLAVHTDQPIGWTRSWLTDMALVHQRATATVREGPTLVVGDFNATRDHPQLRSVLGAGLRDAAEEAGSGWQPTWPSRWRASWLRPLITIDHVLTSPGYRAVGTHTVEVPHTDHLALVAQLRRTKS